MAAKAWADEVLAQLEQNNKKAVAWATIY
jgi:hypothetical protein